MHDLQVRRGLNQSNEAECRNSPKVPLGASSQGFQASREHHCTPDTQHRQTIYRMRFLNWNVSRLLSDTTCPTSFLGFRFYLISLHLTCGVRLWVIALWNNNSTPPLPEMAVYNDNNRLLYGSNPVDRYCLTCMTTHVCVRNERTDD